MKNSLKGYWSVLTVLSLATAIELLDGTALNISLPTIATEFNAGLDSVSWIPLVYFLVISCLLLPFAKTAEIYGTGRIIAGGFLIFTAASYLCTISPGVWWLVLFRGIQAIGGAMMAAGVPAQVAIAFPQNVRGKALGIIMGAGGFALAAGPAIGGYITHYLSWHWIFYINIPLGLIGVILTLYLFEDQKPSGITRKFDYPGVIFLSVAMSAFLFTLTKGSALGWNSPVILLCILLFMIFAPLFFIWENRNANPIINTEIFLSWKFLGAVLFLTLFEILLGGIEFTLPFYLENITGLTPDISGLYLLIPPLIMIIAGPAGGLISDYEGNRLVCSIAALIALLSSIPFVYSLYTDTIHLVIALIMFGAAIGIVASSGASRVIEHSPEKHKITGSAISNLVFYVGMSIGTAAYTLVLQESISLQTKNFQSTIIQSLPPIIFTNAMEMIYIFSAVLAVAALIISISVKNRDIYN
ncbi:MFS transporter [Methanoplanus sp. FWC-SCC4]|uniref:MFS transporter n=1 Tax=Methanochimaera problematica TaxID=2609417 RepID=A0AA97FAW1_9EURY|nr:MFS transporter [Methanoplanus sp. FWC-SCC4]WOF15522.1 MFS transporter [Methanoplanus sp. FWC-SCC4]